nr:hypothetical protein [Nocardia cyriacigeorgica]
MPIPADDRPGRSLLETARGADEPDRVVFSEYHAMGAPTAAFLLRKGHYVLHHYVGFDPELFDMSCDPEQAHDLAADPAYATVLADLESELDRIVDPVEVDRRAKADQAALVASFGGPEVAATIGTVAATPAPQAG